MKIKRQISKRVYQRFVFTVKAFLVLMAASYLKDKVAETVIGENLDLINAQADKSSLGWLLTQRELDSARFETDESILAEFGLPVAMAAEDDELPEGYKACDKVGYVPKDEWTDYKCVRLEKANGFIEEYYEEQLCHSYILIPGTSLLSSGLLGFTYFCFLIYLFLGIGMVSDIFMEAIEVITSQQTQIELWDKDGKKKVYIEVPVWNPTVANLTLMALGSSAPEILLSVIETCKDLRAIPGELGPSTIVGSASFNLLVISAVSIAAVEETPKKVYDVSTFAVTSISSLFAYIWLYICLKGSSSPELVTPAEGWLTLIFFFLLVICAYITDKINQHFEESKKTQAEIE